jgi:hypothetical protein
MTMSAAATVRPRLRTSGADDEGGTPEDGARRLPSNRTGEPGRARRTRRSARRRRREASRLTNQGAGSQASSCDLRQPDGRRGPAVCARSRGAGAAPAREPSAVPSAFLAVCRPPSASRGTSRAKMDLPTVCRSASVGRRLNRRSRAARGVAEEPAEVPVEDDEGPGSARRARRPRPGKRARLLAHTPCAPARRAAPARGRQGTGARRSAAFGPSHALSAFGGCAGARRRMAETGEIEHSTHRRAGAQKRGRRSCGSRSFRASYRFELRKPA